MAIAALFLVPFLAGTGEKSWKRRPVAVLAVLVIVLTVATLAGLGVTVPWSPKMEAWTAAATPVRYVKGRTPLQLQGALVLQNKQCRTCHSLGGEGGKRGVRWREGRSRARACEACGPPAGSDDCRAAPLEHQSERTEVRVRRPEHLAAP